MPDRMVTYFLSRQPHHRRDGICHRHPVRGRDEVARAGADEFGDTAAGESDNRCAAAHRFGDDQSVRLVPHRRDQRRCRSPDEVAQLILIQVAGIANVVSKLRRNLDGKIVRVGNRAGEYEGHGRAPRSLNG